MDEDAEITLLGEEESSNPQTDQNSTGYTISTEMASIEITREPQDGDSEKEQEEEMAEIIKNTAKKPKEGAGHMDKFKRRLIRAIANYIRNDQIPPDEIWEELQKQSGCDCKLLWERMRVLTTKKLQRLFTAGDVLENITEIARLNVTDWLLFDLVLVHEKIDVIGEDEVDPYSKESPKILEDLFATVVIYNLENLAGDDLAKAWFEATRHYNGKVRQASPMLLQRRWYQMKARVREKFYQFWFSYRGDQRLLAAANDFRPTDLEMEIVKHFKYITIKAFPSWEEMIEQKRVALPEDFERLKLAKRRIFRTGASETGPDIELIEPQIETIDLGKDSDSEESRDSTAMREPQQNVDLGIVKTEKIDEISDDDDVRVLENMHIPLQSNDNDENEKNLENAVENIVQEEINDIDMDEHHSPAADEDHEEDSINATQLLSATESDDNILANVQSNDFADHQEVFDDQGDTGVLMPKIVASTSIANISVDLDDLMPEITNVSSNANLRENANDTVSNEVNGILESLAENMSAKKLYNVPLTTDTNITNQLKVSETDALVKNIIDEEINSKVIENAADNEKTLDSLDAVPNDMFDGIELEDDGIEYVEEDDSVTLLQPKIEIKTENTENNDSGNTPTIDLKLLLTPVVYTKKLDDMDVFRFIEYNSVKDKRVIENAGHESKPVDRNSVKMEEISQERQPTAESETFSDSASEYYSEEEIGPETVSLSSWLLNKPRVASYNPIQLCKNPDFNTRLKRLSAGFFSSERNRHLLKECKPLTIDLHKSFETKLHDNTLYLKETKSVGYKTGGLGANAIERTAPPSALPIENLKSNLINDFLGPLSRDSLATQPVAHQALPDSHLVERKKVNLPDLAQIRRLNERLLTAEVTPIQASCNIKPPVNIVINQQNNNTFQNNTIDANASKGINIFASDKSNITSNISNKNNVTSGVTSEVQQIKSTKVPIEVVKKSDNAFNSSSLSSGNLVSNTQKTKSAESVRGGPSKTSTTIQKKNGKEVKKHQRVHIPWISRCNTQPIPHDVLLTSDTVDKILNICRGDNELVPQKLKQFNKALRKNALKESQKELIANKSTCQNEQVKKAAVGSESLASEQEPKEPFKEIVAQPIVKKKSKMERSLEYIRKERKIYCCWAREKILKLGTKKRVANKHNCPRPLCHCCCRQELVVKMFDAKRGQKAPNSKEQITTPTIKVTSAPSRYDKPTEMPPKVSVGINTDYDPEFEKGFAANLDILKASSKSFDLDNYLASNIQVRYPPNIYQANGQTQTTFVNMNMNINNDQTVTIESDSSNEGTFIPIKIPAVLNDNNATLTLTQGPAVNVNQTNDQHYPTASNKASKLYNLIPKKISLLKKPINPTLSNENERKKKLIIQNNPILKGHPYTILSKTQAIAPGDLSPIKSTCQTPVNNPFSSDNWVTLQERNESDKVLLFRNKTTKNAASRTPIWLGKNKILLCSFDQPHLINQLKGDKVTTITNNDNNQNNDDLSHNIVQSAVALPAGVRIVLLPNKELAVSIDPGIELDQSQLAYLPTLMATIQQQLAAADITTKTVTSPIDQIRTSKDHNNIPLNSCNETETILDDKKENDTVSLACNEKLRDTSDKIMEVNIVNQAELVNNVTEKSNCVLGGSNDLDDLKDSTDSNKKTILSDLMEMSGISAEDTHSTNNVSPSKQQSELIPPLIIQGLKSQITNQHNEKYFNNPLLSNTAVQTVLRMCPELCIVFSYQELRYASENNAQFYKMDIETGVVVPISVVIKRQIQGNSNKKNEVKAVIDLTDDPEENESIHIEEQTAETLETRSAVEQQKAPVPVQLFSTARPNILKQSRSLLQQGVTSPTKSLASILFKKKRMLKLIRRKKPTVKPPAELIASIDLDSDTEQNDETSVNTTPVAGEKRKCDEDSDSDDEPLALKSKRMKDSSETTEPNQIIDKDGQEDNQLDDNQYTEVAMAIEVPELVPDNPTIDDTPNITEAEGEADINLTPHIEPVVFDPISFGANAAESDEDCILGV